jgi:hypothetical protein
MRRAIALPVQMRLDVRLALANHRLVLGLEAEDVVRQALPRFAKRRVLVVEDVGEPVVELRGDVRPLVEVARAVVLSWREDQSRQKTASHDQDNKPCRRYRRQRAHYSCACSQGAVRDRVSRQERDGRRCELTLMP